MHDTQKANLVWQETLRLIGMPVEVVEEIVNGSDAVDITGDLNHVDTFDDVNNDGALDFLLGNSNEDGVEFGNTESLLLLSDGACL